MFKKFVLKKVTSAKIIKFVEHEDEVSTFWFFLPEFQSC